MCDGHKDDDVVRVNDERHFAIGMKMALVPLTMKMILLLKIMII